MIKKIIVMLVLIMILTACGTATEAGQEERFTYGDWYLSVTEDTTTGCKYILYQEVKGSGITPLLKSDGTPDCSN